jgi:DtxR family Mn-dependent transcriptional regulator
VVSRHQVLRDFFVDVLDVDEQLAQRAACRMEHSLPQPILARLRGFVEYLESDQRQGGNLIGDFKSRIERE